MLRRIIHFGDAVGQDRAKHDGPGGDGIGEPLVIAGLSRQLLLDQAAGRCIGQQREHALGAGPVGLREHHVEGDRGGAHFGEAAHEFAEPRTRPGPLPDAAQRFVVDVDDPHRRLGIPRARRDALIGIEDKIAEIVEAWALENAEGQKGDERQKHRRRIGPASGHLPAPKFGSSWNHVPD